VLREIGQFLRASLEEPGALWTDAGVESTASRHVPDLLLRSRRHLLQADINQLWAMWFLEFLCDTKAARANSASYPIIAGIVKSALDRIVPPETSHEERIGLLQVAVRLVSARLKINEDRRRVINDISVKEELLRKAGSPPRRWICGYAFLDEAIERFLENKLQLWDPKLPAFLDFMRPHGLATRDLKPEVDHVNPFCVGGEEGRNLRIACGWCNAKKSWKCSVYDTGSEAEYFKHPMIGQVSVPRPFWVVRLLAVRKRCEHINGCSASSINTHMLIAPVNGKGVANPLNLRLVCPEHDTIVALRLVHRSSIRRNPGPM